MTMRGGWEEVNVKRLKRSIATGAILLFAGSTSVFAAEEEQEKIGLVLRPYGAVMLGVNDFFRGGGVGP